MKHNLKRTYLEGDEGLDGTALHLEASGDDLDDTAIEHLVSLGQARNGHKLDFEDHVSARVLDHTVFNLQALLVLMAKRILKSESVKSCGLGSHEINVEFRANRTPSELT